MRVVILGSRGQLESDIGKVLRANPAREVREFDVEDFDISDFPRLNEVLAEVRPDAVVNTAAFHNVEKCEEEPQTAFLVNALAVRNLARACRDSGAQLVHFSTDYVFDGRKGSPYLEQDLPGPLSVYANSKLAGEHFVQSETENYYILRVSGLYGLSPCRAKGGMNFVDLMLKLARERGRVRVVNDEFLTPTSTIEIARQLDLMLEKMPPSGIYHSTAEGSCSWHGFAAEIFRQGKVDVVLEEAAPGEFAAKVQRPKYSVLENGNLKRAGINRMISWQEALQEYMVSRHGI